MSVIKITKHTAHDTDQVELAISVMCMVNDIRLSKTVKKVLAFFVVYGVKETTDKLILNSKIVKDLQGLRNAKTRLLKTGFLKRDPDNLYKTYELNTSKDFNLSEDITLLIKIKCK